MFSLRLRQNDGSPQLTASRLAVLASAAVFVALLIDGMDLQMLAFSLSNISKELHLSTVDAGALSSHTLLGMGLRGVFAGRLADRIGLLGVSYAVCALVPGLFIREKMFDPSALETRVSADVVNA